MTENMKEIILPEGNCLLQTLLQCMRNPHYLFCYGIVKHPNPRIHAWVETKGFVKDGMVFTERGNILAKEIFVLDFNNGKKLAVPKEKYYTQKSVTEKEVKKLYLSEVLKKMSEFTKMGKDCWGWIEN